MTDEISPMDNIFKYNMIKQMANVLKDDSLKLILMIDDEIEFKNIKDLIRKIHDVCLATSMEDDYEKICSAKETVDKIDLEVNILFANYYANKLSSSSVIYF